MEPDVTRHLGFRDRRATLLVVESRPPPALHTPPTLVDAAHPLPLRRCGKRDFQLYTVALVVPPAAPLSAATASYTVCTHARDASLHD